MIVGGRKRMMVVLVVCRDGLRSKQYDCMWLKENEMWYARERM